jgi:hypothetical protein
MRLPSLFAALVLVGCANTGDEGMIVLNNTAVTDSCTLTGAPDQPFRSHGEIFAGAKEGYVLTPLIQSRLTTEIGGSGSGSGTVDPITKTIFLKGADVKVKLVSTSIITAGAYTTTQNNLELGTYSVLFAGYLPPDGYVNVGFEALSVPMIQSVVAMSGVDFSSSDLRAEVLTEVTVKGELGGDTISATPFSYPITVCSDCIAEVTGPCPVMEEPLTGNACNMWQDGHLQCCSNPDGTYTCPSTVATTTP